MLRLSRAADGGVPGAPHGRRMYTVMAVQAMLRGGL